jgi:hypothetical protein
MNSNFEGELHSVRNEVHAYKTLYRGRFFFFLSYPGRHFPILGIVCRSAELTSKLGLPIFLPYCGMNPNF